MIRKVKDALDRTLHLMATGDVRHGLAMESVIVLVWGLLLLLPADTFGAFEGYRLMETIAPEWAWGVVMALTGFFKGYAVTYDRRELASKLAVLSFFLWLMISVALISLNWQTTATAVYPLLSIGNAVAWWSLKQ